MVSVVIPTRNEASNVPPLVDRVMAALGETPFEICFVDDSDNSTGDLLLDLAQSNPSIRCLVRHGADRAGGLSTAVVAGLRMARGRYVCVMDADLQHPPELIPVLLAEAERGADLVVASRYAPGGSHEGLGGTVRRLVSRGATVVARVLFREARQSADPLSGYFLCRRALIDGIEFRPVGFKILLELLVCVPELRVVDVPVTQGPRTTGVSKATARQGLMYLRHLRSLFFDVPGSARFWKFGLVGLSGLCVFLPVLAILIGIVGWNPFVAFVPAFGLSAAWNTVMNWRLTFGDQRRGGGGSRHYLEFALLSGCVMFAVFALLVDAGLASVLAAAAAALVAMLINGLVNRAHIHRSPSVWTAIAIDQGVQGGLDQAGRRGRRRSRVPAPGPRRGVLEPAGRIARPRDRAPAAGADHRGRIAPRSAAVEHRDCVADAAARRSRRRRGRGGGVRAPRTGRLRFRRAREGDPGRRRDRAGPRRRRRGAAGAARGGAGSHRARNGEVIPTAAGTVAAGRPRGVDRAGIATRAGLCAGGIALAVAVRVAIGGTQPAASMPAALVFAIALGALAAATGWRPARPRRSAIALGGAGGAALVAAWLTARGVAGVQLAPANTVMALWTPLVALVAVAEEVALRGAMFGAVRAAGGDGWALVATTLLFALIHLPLYGISALPLDLAAGLLLGGLRVVSGGVLAPAVAHVIADLAGGWLL